MKILKICISAIVLLVLSLFGCSRPTINHYKIDINKPEKKIVSDKLKLGGKNVEGDSISINNYYMKINDEPVIPIAGEFHFSRYPNKYWDESMRKMKAGGINVIATYVFWIIHEEKEGIFDWTGDKDLRKFIELCAVNDMKVIVRIGPFCHGEIRNGGLPDWLWGNLSLFVPTTRFTWDMSKNCIMKLENN